MRSHIVSFTVPSFQFYLLSSQGLRIEKENEIKCLQLDLSLRRQLRSSRRLRQQSRPTGVIRNYGAAGNNCLTEQCSFSPLEVNEELVFQNMKEKSL